MNDYKATLDYDTVVACRDALKLKIAILEVQLKSSYELAHNKEFNDACRALSIIEQNL